MLTKYGTDNIIIMLGVSILFFILAFVFRHSFVVYPLAAAGILLAAFTLWFFRDPDRNIPESAKNDSSIILAPADGRVVEIAKEKENIYLSQEAIRISIFLSPLDVHVNRSPAGGVIEYFKYNPGDYLVAFYPKSSELNEQTHIGLNTGFGKIFFKQIVGIVARRLVWDIKVGDTVQPGQKFGMMKFGSRMDVFVSANSKINIKIGDKVVAGETIIARLQRLK